MSQPVSQHAEHDLRDVVRSLPDDDHERMADVCLEMARSASTARLGELWSTLASVTRSRGVTASGILVRELDALTSRERHRLMLVCAAGRDAFTNSARDVLAQLAALAARREHVAVAASRAMTDAALGVADTTNGPT